MRDASAAVARPARDGAEIGEVFSITLRVSHRRSVFADLDFGHYCVGYLCALRHIVGHPVVAYCLMPDHVHLLVVAGPCGSVRGFAARWKSICAFEWRRRTHRGSFWLPRLRDGIVRVESGVQEIAARVLDNPVRAGLVARPEDYPLCGSFEWESAALESLLPARGVPRRAERSRGRPRPVPTSSSAPDPFVRPSARLPPPPQRR